VILTNIILEKDTVTNLEGFYLEKINEQVIKETEHYSLDYQSCHNVLKGCS
jgi:hypothetical protein